MSEMRVGWGAAATVVAAVLVLSGCGGGSDDDKSASSPAPSPSVSQEPPAATTPEETEPEYPPGPEGDIDRKAAEEGWTWDSLYPAASDFVSDICVSLPDEAKNWSPEQWLVEHNHLAGDGQAMLEFGVPKLCPEWKDELSRAVAGDYDRWISGGDYEVVSDPAPYDPEAESDVQEIKPGTYRAEGEFSDCYWERTSASGDIIANQFVTQARVLTVTLNAGELFTQDCGTFRPVG